MGSSCWLEERGERGHYWQVERSNTLGSGNAAVVADDLSGERARAQEHVP